MPRCEGAHHEPNNAAHHRQHDEVDGQQRIQIFRVVHHFGPEPRAANRKGVEGKDGGVNQKEDEGLVVAQPDTRRQPWAVVVHLEDASAACRAVVRAIWLASLALLAESKLAVALDCEGRCRAVLAAAACREKAVAVDIGRRPGIRKDGRRVGPVEQQIERDANGRGYRACICAPDLSASRARNTSCISSPTYPAAAVALAANAHHHPARPRRQAVDKHQGEVSGRRATSALYPARPTERHAGIVTGRLVFH